MLKISIDGITGMQKELSGMVNRGRLHDALLESALLVEREAKIRCPVQYGNLIRTITHHKISDLTYEIGAYAPYADYIEYGTRLIICGSPDNPMVYTSSPPGSKYPSYRPFLRSALYDKMPEIEQIFNKLTEEKE